MQVVKGFINYSDFGWFISFGGHHDIYDEVEIYIPDEYKIAMNMFDEPLIYFGEHKYLLCDIIQYKREKGKEDKIRIYNMTNPHNNSYINLNYKKI